MLNQLVRYSAVVPLIDEIGSGRLLDVGSGSMSVAPRLGPEWEVTALDRSFDDYGVADGPADTGAARVVGDAAALPFPDRSFDVVLALDILEHIPPERRATVLGELGRTASRRAIVACPAGPRAQEADRRLAEHYARRGRPEPGWLREHVDYPFPTPDVLAAGLRPFGRVRIAGNENLRTHQLLMRAESAPRSGILAAHLADALAPAGRVDGRAAGLARAAVRVLRGFDRPPVYRTVVVLDRP